MGGSGYNQTLGFQYNPASQLSSKTATNTLYAYTGYAAKNLTYGNANSLNQIPTAGTAALTYDTRGNLASTGSGAVSYSYDRENNLTATSATATLTYDPIDRLETTTGSTTGTTQFLYDGNHIIAEYSGGGVTNRYVFGPGMDEPLVWYVGSGTSTPLWTIADNRGSIIAVTNASGTPYSTSTSTGINIYDEYGAPAANNLGRFQYTGQAWVPETALYHYKARAYNPNLGRFLQTDPAGYGAGMNLYAYVGNDPINGADTTGLNDDAPDNSNLGSAFGPPPVTTITIIGTKDLPPPEITLDLPPWGVPSLPYTPPSVSLPTPTFTIACHVNSINISQTGQNINISGKISFPNGQRDYLNYINNAWTGFFGQYNVTSNMQIGNGGLVANISNGPNGRPSASVGGPNMYLNTLEGATPSQLSYSQWTAGHEFGHAGLGLKDQYTDANGPNPGYENDIMGAVNGTPSANDIDTAMVGCH